MRFIHIKIRLLPEAGSSLQGFHNPEPSYMGMKGEHGSSKRSDTHSNDMMSLLGCTCIFSSLKADHTVAEGVTDMGALGSNGSEAEMSSPRRTPAAGCQHRTSPLRNKGTVSGCRSSLAVSPSRRPV